MSFPLVRKVQQCWYHPYSEATIESMCGGGNFVQDHSERMPWDHGQLMLPLNIHLLSYNSCPGVDVFQNSRILLVTKVKADFLFKFASS